MSYTTNEIRTYYSERMPRLKTGGIVWRGPCPVHGGKDDNFTVDPETGRAYCHSRCQRGWSMTQLEMELSACDARDAAARISSRNAPPAPRIAAEYDYRDEQGKLLFQVLRYEPKTFRQRRPTDYGTWEWNMDGVRRVIYRLPEVLAAGCRTIHVVEGEKDVHNLEAIGLNATCNPGGAGKWKPEYSESLRGLYCCIIPDNDEPGIRHGLDIARSLLGIARGIWWVPPPHGHKDVSEFLNSDGFALEAWDAWMETYVDIKTQEQIDELTPKPKVVCITDSVRPEPAPEKTLPDFPEGVWSGFAAQYRDMLSGVTEAPPSFHMASLLTATGCLMGRQVLMKSPRPLYGNLFTLLVGSTSMARKTTAIQYACDLVMNTALNLGVKIRPMYGIASVEGLAANMVEKDGAPLRVFAIEDEFRSLLKKGQQKSVSNLIPRLTEAYNHLPTFEVNTRTDKVTVNGFFLSMAAASTPEWFMDSMTALEISGGFLNRWCIFSGRAERPIALPDPVNKEHWKELVQSLTLNISNASCTNGGERALSESARMSYERFYDEHWYSAEASQAGQATARVAMHALKFGLIFSAMEGHDNIEVDDIERGIAVAKYCADSASVLASDVGSTRTRMLEKRVLSELRAEPLSATELIRKLRVSADDLNKAVRALEIAEMILSHRQTTTGRSRIVYSLAA